MGALEGCNGLPFSARIAVEPDVQSASTSTGLTVKVSVPQEAGANANGRVDADVRDTTVTLPEGVQLNPSAGDGLQSCTGEPGALPTGQLWSPGDEIGYREWRKWTRPYGQTFSEGWRTALEQGIEFCRMRQRSRSYDQDAAAAEPTEGLGLSRDPERKPVREPDRAVPGRRRPDLGGGHKAARGSAPGPDGQLTTTFENNPQAPFEDPELHFFGGERAPLATPARCGAYTTTATFTPWSGNAPARPPRRSTSPAARTAAVSGREPAVQPVADGRHDEHQRGRVQPAHDDDRP